MTDPTSPPQPWERSPARRRWTLIASAIAAVLAIVAAVVVVLVVRSDDEPSSPPGTATTTATTSTRTSVPTSSPTTTKTTTGPTGTTTATRPPAFGYQPLWPFGSVSEAQGWQREYRTGGHQPWHLDAEMTAQQFTQNYLGYREVDRVLGRKISGDQAWVDVGFELPNGDTATAATVHLVKIGAGSDAPWEVVGTRDTTLSLTTPGYGSAVTSPVTVGGRITGVDENLRVRIWRQGSGKVGESGGVPAGGDNSPWSTKVSFAAPAGSVLTIAVSTGGHVAAVERFAITGVRVAE